MPADNVDGDVVDELKKGIDAMVKRRMSDKIATKEDIVDELQAYGKYPDVEREKLLETPIGVLETEAEEIPGAIKTDDGIVFDAGDDATANASDVDADNFGSGVIGEDVSMSGGDFTADAYGDDATANSDPHAGDFENYAADDADPEDFGSGVIGR